MKISDLLKLSTDNLRRRKGRTVLTLIGVVIGTCLIVVMISLGIALNQQYEEMGREIRDALLQVRQQAREEAAAAAAPKAAVTCPYCGATTTPDASGCCEFCGGAVNG